MSSIIGGDQTHTHTTENRYISISSMGNWGGSTGLYPAKFSLSFIYPPNKLTFVYKVLINIKLTLTQRYRSSGLSNFLHNPSVMTS